MRIHHLGCGTDCPLGGALFDGRSIGPLGRIVCHCLLIETDAHGLVLVDMGNGLRDVAHPHRGPRPAHHPAVADNAQHPAARSRYRDPTDRGAPLHGRDVRHIVATHLDFDHAGGLEDSPNAVVHVMQREYDDATGPRTGIVARNRWQTRQLEHATSWRRYDTRGEPWFGFDAVRDLDGLPPEILLVPLPGHTRGHAGDAVRRDDSRWLLHAGDAYFYRGEMRGERRECTPGLRAYQRLMEVDSRSRMDNQSRLRALSVERREEVTITCTHDPVELERCQAGRPLESTRQTAKLCRL